MPESNTEFINDWVGKIKASQRFRKKYLPTETLQDYRKYYRGDWAAGLVPVNRIFSFGRSLIPAVYFRLPRVAVTATKPDMVFHARVVEAVDNWLIRETLLKGTLKTSILNTFLGGTGPIKIGYDSEFGYSPAQAVDEDTSTVTQASTKEERLIEYRTGIKPGMPWALPELAENVIIPIGYKDPSSLPWVAHRILRPLDDIKQDQKYAKAATKELSGTRMMQLVGEDVKSVFKDSEDKIVYGELFEVRNVATKEIYVFCENRLLLASKDSLQIEGLPWEFMIFNEDPEYFHGIPDIKMIEPQALELNDVRTQASRHRKIALLKFLYLKGAIKEEELEKLLSGEVGPAVGIDGESLPAAVMMLQPHIPPDLAQESMMVKQDMRESLGFSENQGAAFRGGTPPSATETMEVAQTADLRTDERKDIVRDILVNIVRKWNQIIFSFWTGERVAQIAGPGGEQEWVQYTGDQLKGEYTLNIDPDTGFPVSRQLRGQAAESILEKYGGDQLVDQLALRRYHLSQFEWIFPGISNILKDDASRSQADIMSVSRQPHPMGKGASSRALGNRGGGRQGMSPEKPANFEDAKARHTR